MILPTRRVAYAIAATSPLWLLSATRLGTAPASAALTIIAIAVVVDLVRIPSAKALTLERRVSPSAGLGEELPISYEISSSWNRPIAFTLLEYFPTGFSDPEWRELSAVVAERGSLTLEMLVVPSRRGVYGLGDVAIRIESPFGLVASLFRRRIRDTVTVAPSLQTAGRYRLLALQQRLQLAGAHAVRKRGAGMAFSNLREYVRGDDPRFIDWKHSARREKLISREYSVEQGQTLLIAVDAGRMMTELAGDRSRFELALSSALALASVAISTGDKVGFIVFDDSIRALIAPASGPRALHAIRNAVIGVGPTMTEPDYAKAFAKLSSQQRSRSLVVVFTDVIDPRASRSVIVNTMRAGARHLPLVVALRNDPLFAATTISTGGKPGSVYQKAAAEEMVQARSEALQRMRSTGTMVIDISPETMTPAVINRYLEIKARGAL